MIKKIMKRKDITKKVLRASEGMFSSLIDLTLTYLFFFAEISPLGHPANLGKAEYLAEKHLRQFNYETIKRAFYNAKSRGWIKEDLILTKEGKERLKNLTPIYFGKKKWDGNWYLVSYDIPEKRRNDRGILREHLKRLGFGEMHASLWVSPFNFFGEVEKLVQEYKLSSFVILAVSDKVGRQESKILANKIWKLDEINQDYKEIIEKAQKKFSKILVFEYFCILEKDPQLPSELLPEDWLGEEAHSIFKKYILVR